MIPAAVPDRLRLALLENVKVEGPLCDKAAAILEARYLSDRAEAQVLREAVDAFRNRVDDGNPNGRGMWQGEFWGKWILGAVAAARHTGHPKLLARIRKGVDDLLATRDANGYIGTYRNSRFGQESPGRVFEWNLWCRKYTLWGLLEAAELLDHEEARQGAKGILEHLMSEVGPGRYDIIRTGWMAGLPSTSLLGPVVLLYRQTSDPVLLEYARYIVDQWGANPEGPPDLLRRGLTGEDLTRWFPNPERWAKAYELMSCVEGMLELYRATGEADLLTAGRNIFDSICDTDRHIFGGISVSDMLAGGRFQANAPSEICDGVYWVRLAVQLLRLTGEARYADEIERTLYNVLFAGAGLDPFWGLRRQVLAGEHWRAPQHCGLETHHCCVANLPRGLYQSMQTVVLQADDGLAIALYLPGEYHMKDSSGHEIAVFIDTDYPRDEQVRLSLRLAKESVFTLRLRIPGWCRGKTSLAVDGAPIEAEDEGGWIRLHREWTPRSEVRLVIPLQGRVAPLPLPGGLPDQSFRTVMRGPIALARDIRLGDEGSIHEPVTLTAAKDGSIELMPEEAPENIWMAFSASVQPNRRGLSDRIRLCDFSSAGNTWDRNTSDFRLWLQDCLFDPHTGA